MSENTLHVNDYHVSIETNVLQAEKWNEIYKFYFKKHKSLKKIKDTKSSYIFVKMLRRCSIQSFINYLLEIIVG